MKMNQEDVIEQYNFGIWKFRIIQAHPNWQYIVQFRAGKRPWRTPIGHSLFGDLLISRAQILRDLERLIAGKGLEEK